MKLKILHLEDNDLDAEIINNILQEEGMECSITRASTKKEYFSALHQNDYDIILSDNAIPDYDGINALKYAREHKPHIPFVYVSGTIGEERAIDALRYGARDYVLKQNLNKLVPTIQRIVHESNVEQARIHAESALRASEERYKRIIAGITDYVYTVKIRNGKAVETIHNDASIITGYTPKEFAADPYLWINIVVPEEREIVINKISKIIDGKDISPIEHRIICKDGKIKWVSDTAIPKYDSNGKLISYDGVVKDITESKRTEETLIKLSSAVEQTVDTVVITDRNGTIEYVNHAFEALTGYSSQETLGKTPRILKSGASDQKYYETMWKTILSGKVFRAEVLNKKKNGTLYFEGKTITPIFDKNKTITHFVSTGVDITERKQAEETLRRSEEKFSSAFRSASYALIISRASDGRIIDVNDIFFSATGYSLEETIGKTTVELKLWVKENDRKYVISELMKGNRIISNEFSFRNKSGDVLICLFSAEIITLFNEKCILSSINDITERKHAEKALKESEERFRSLYENSTIGIYRTTPDGQILLSNPTLVKMLGYSSFQELAVRNLEKDRFEPTYERTQFLNQIEVEGEVIGLESAWARKDGTMVFIRESAKAIRDANGKTLYYDGTVEDITERKRAEAELSKLKKAVDNSGEVIFLTNKEGVFTFVNPAFISTYGYTVDETVGKATPRILRGVLHENFTFNSFWEYLKNGKEVRCEFINKRKDDSTINIEGSATSIYDERKNIIGFLGIQMDITKRKRAEQELIAAKEKAEEMNKVKNFFLSNMSHELRTPLISVLGFAELLQNELVNPEHLSFVNNIIEGGQRLNITLTEILEVSKLETEKSFVKLQTCNLADEIEINVKTFLPMAHSKRLFLKTELTDTNLIANIDPELFGKALYHLISNALKFTKEGGVFVSLHQERKQDLDWTVTSVIDTGIGISKQNLDKIFDEFRQVDEGLGRSHEGTGLGLTIAKGIVETMKGHIQVESEIGNLPAGKAGGSTFSIWLPAILDDKQIMMKVWERSRTTIIKPPTTSERGLKKALIVDDNSPNRLFMNHCLSTHLRIIEAQDGITGVTLASKEHFDLILMDINLGEGIDGVEAMNQIRKIPGYLKVPIIAVTAYAMIGDKERFLSEGFDNYIAKPFTKSALLSLVENSLLETKK